MIRATDHNLSSILAAHQNLSKIYCRSALINPIFFSIFIHQIPI